MAHVVKLVLLAHFESVVQHGREVDERVLIKPVYVCVCVGLFACTCLFGVYVCLFVTNLPYRASPTSRLFSVVPCISLCN